MANPVSLQAGSPPGLFIARTVILPGQTTFTTSSNTNTIRLRMVAGGGGAGGTASVSTNFAMACGGGSGSYAEKQFAVAPSTIYACSVGAAGAGGAAGNNNGQPGGTTSFTVGSVTVTCNPGQGGGGAGSGLVASTIGVAGTLSTNGDINFPGADGGIGFNSGLSGNGQTSTGASAALGIGVGAVSAFTTNNVAKTPSLGSGYGFGGSAPNSSGTVSAIAGQPGGSGVIIVEEYT